MLLEQKNVHVNPTWPVHIPQGSGDYFRVVTNGDDFGISFEGMHASIRSVMGLDWGVGSNYVFYRKGSVFMVTSYAHPDVVASPDRLKNFFTPQQIAFLGDLFMELLG